MSTISTSRASYNRPRVHIGGHIKRTPAPFKVTATERELFARVTAHVQKALKAETKSTLDYNKTEIIRLLRNSL